MNRLEAQIVIEDQELPKSLSLAYQLENTDDESLIRNRIGSLLDSMKEDLHVDFTYKVSELYSLMLNEGCLARVESLYRVLKTIEQDLPLEISDKEDTHYANAVIPNQAGIKIAFSEGQAPGPIRLMVGFGKTTIGFKSENIQVEEVDFNENDLRGAKERRYVCRHVSGILNKNDIKYIILRLPFSFVEEKYMTETERQRKPNFIFRGLKL